MPEYGVTPNGIVIKRLDAITNEIHDDLTDGWDFNTRQNPESFLGVLITNFADKIAELWEFGQDVYYSMYPSSAEGINLDNAAQYGGSVREAAAKTYYPMHCEGVDGTVISSGTIISSVTNPAVNFVLSESGTITRASFNKVKVKIFVVKKAAYTIALNNMLYTHSSGEDDTEEEILNGLYGVVTDANFTTKIENNCLVIEAINIQSNNTLVLTENLTTESVTSIISFGSEEFGDVVLPNNTITNIVKAVPGFKNCTNLCDRIAGRVLETDAEFRRSYIDKIFIRSSMMLETVKSVLLQNVQGIRSVEPYQNDTPAYDDYGRPPHSLEVVIDGGSDYEIAKYILASKAAGIVTYGNTEVAIPGDNGEDIMIRFNRPVYVYTWFRVKVYLNHTETLPTNYVELIKETIIDNMDEVSCGENVIPQKFVKDIYAKVTGLEFIEILAFSSEQSTDIPDEYTQRNVKITPRQRAITEKTKIEVTLNE